MQSIPFPCRTALHTVLSLAATLALAACATQPQPTPTPVAQTPARPAPTPPATRPDRPRATRAPAAATITDRGGPIGVSECDSYLDNYKACHNTIGTVGNLDERHAALRATMLGKTATAEGREEARVICSSLQATMKEALDGRACTLPQPAGLPDRK